MAYIGIPNEQADQYKVLEYIECTGTQYINTGFKPNQNTGVLLDFQATDISQSNEFIGGRYTSTKQAFTFAIYSGLWYFGYKAIINTGISADTERHLLQIDKNVCALDGTTICEATYSEFTAYKVMGIGRTFAVGSTVYEGYAKIYSCKIYDNGTMVRDFIPCVNSDGEAGLYDLVNATFYANVGSGEFVLGAETGEVIGVAGKISKCYIGIGGRGLPDGYTEVEYIESSGTQYIDTGFMPNQSTRTVMDVEPSTNCVASAFYGFFGARADGVYYAVIKAKKNTWNIYYQYCAVYTTAWAVSNLSEFAVRRTIDANGATATIDGTSKTYSPQQFQLDYSIYLFACNEKGDTNYFMPAKLYSCRIWDNDTLVRDFVPCINASGVAGLYDLVTETFFANAGSGSFATGEVIQSVARQIRRAYIGDENGIARVCYSLYPYFIPADASRLVTADGGIFVCKE